MKLLIKIILSVFILESCNSKEEKTQPVIENISESVYASGIIKSKNQYQVFSTVNGLIQEIL
ncbi:MAG: RND transporter, partial [Bacteroidetes bacterium]|nr:RND transporter [Bacteroidota bacterium]